MSGSNLASMVALLGAGMGGYARGKRQYDEQQSDNEERQWRRESRMWQRKDRDDADALKRDVAEAAKPLSAVDTSVYQPALDDEGNSMPANPTDGRQSVGGVNYSDPNKALKAVSDLNAPRARMARMADAYERGAQPEKAFALRTNSMQNESAEMQLNAQRRAEVDRAYNVDLFNRATDFQTLEQFVSESKGDHESGALKIKFVPSADGKMMNVVRLMPDGKQTPTPYSFENNRTGFMQAVGTVGARLPPEQKIAHLQGIAKTDEDRRRWDSEFDLKKQEVEGKVRYWGQVGGAATTKANNAGQAEPAPLWDEDSDKFLRQRYTVTDPTSGAVGVDGGGLQFAKRIAVGQARHNGGDTVSALGFAFEKDNELKAAATDPKGNYSPEKHAELRAGYLDALMPKRPVPTRASASTVAPSRRQTMLERVMQDMERNGVKNATFQTDGQEIKFGAGASTPAPKVESSTTASLPPEVLEAKLLQEMTLMGEGKLMQHSPEVQQYLVVKRVREQEAAQAQLAVRQQAEFRRARMGGL